MATRDSIPLLNEEGCGNTLSSRDPQGFTETVFNATVDPLLENPVLYDYKLASINVIVQKGIGIKLQGAADGYALALEQTFKVPVTVSHMS